MKNVCRFKNLLLITLLALVPVLGLAKEGGAGPGGGNTTELEFTTYGKQIAKYLEAFPETFNGEISAKAFKKVVLKTQVRSSNENLEIEGSVKVAINFPKRNLIKLNSSKWAEIETGSERAAIVAHEYFGILGLDNQSAYRLSNQILVDPVLKHYFDTLDVAAGEALPMAFACSTNYKKNIERPTGEVQVGLGLDIPGAYQYTPVSGHLIDSMEDGRALAIYLITSDADQIGVGLGPIADKNQNVLAKTKIKGPSVRLLVGYGQWGFFTFPTEILLQRDIRVIGPIHESMSILSGELEIDCRTINHLGP